MGEEVITDLLGVEVKLGSRIAYSAADGRSSGLRIGHVLEIVPGREQEYGYAIPTKLRVSVEHTTSYGIPAKPTLIDPGFKRFVVIG